MKPPGNRFRKKSNILLPKNRKLPRWHGNAGDGVRVKGQSIGRRGQSKCRDNALSLYSDPKQGKISTVCEILAI
jgi:hypothetical protein